MALVCCLVAGMEARAEPQYILLNLTPGRGWNDQRAATLQPAHLDALRAALPLGGGEARQIGVCYIFSYLNCAQPELLEASLRQCLATAQELRVPVLIALDGENWWGGRPDLWNWWDPGQPGYDPANAANVEWTGPGPEYAVKVGWRDWGRQLRVLPQPNLLAPQYRAACAEQLRRLVPILAAWYRALPADAKDLFVGLKLGWESSIGVQAWHYLGGNARLAFPPETDPTTGLDHSQRPGRGVAALGYAAATVAGLLTDGELSDADQAEIVRRHLADLSRQARALGLPRARIYTHAGGWAPDEPLYQAALNADSCPGWSFYQHAGDPLADPGVRRAVAGGRAPRWAAVEWLQGGNDEATWRRALEQTLAAPGCQFVCIYNWEGLAEQPGPLAAIRAVAGR